MMKVQVTCIWRWQEEPYIILLDFFCSLQVVNVSNVTFEVFSLNQILVKNANPTLLSTPNDLLHLVPQVSVHLVVFFVVLVTTRDAQGALDINGEGRGSKPLEK
jgi:hypothetical protein